MPMNFAVASLAVQVQLERVEMLCMVPCIHSMPMYKCSHVHKLQPRHLYTSVKQQTLHNCVVVKPLASKPSTSTKYTSTA